MVKSLCGRDVSNIGLGTWGMGGKQAPTRRDDQRHVDAIRFALDNGINVIDTAEMYASGHTEEIVGKSIRGYDREEIFIISKVWNTNLHRETLLKSAKKSIERMESGYIDLYLIHWPNPAVPITETITAMGELVSSGLVRNIGVSNFNVAQIQEAMEVVTEARICANQIEYNYGNRTPEKDIIPFCEKNGVDVIAYTPIMRGTIKGFDKLEKISEKYGASPIQMALRYTMERSIPIPKSSNPEHILELIRGSEIELEPEDYRLLTE